MQKQIRDLDFTGQDIFVGIDVHLKSWKVTIMMKQLYEKTFSQPPQPEALYTHLKNNYPGANYHSAYEAGFSGYWTHNKLKELGINSIVVNAADIPTTSKEKVQKDDKRDSRKIARSLRNGELTPIHVPTLPTLEDRGLVRLRKTIVNDTTSVKNRIKSFLYFNGLDSQADCEKANWSKKFIKWLENLSLNGSNQLALNALLRILSEHRLNLLDVTKQISALSKTDVYRENVELLKSIPGIGLITAMVIITELENMDRFESMDKLCSFIGLIPSTNSSGENEKTGDITPRGHGVLRSMIIESAWVATRIDPVLANYYHKQCKRMKPNQAIIRVAKKLVSRIRFVLKNKEAYECGVVK